MAETGDGRPPPAWSWPWFWGKVELWEDLPSSRVSVKSSKLLSFLVCVEGSIESKQDVAEYNLQMQYMLRRNGFNLQVYSVACLGFLASSYALFATSIISPALDYIYKEDFADERNRPIASTTELLDLVTLGGIILGMISFGHLADRVGRKRLYGLELIIIAVATMGIAFSSEGFYYMNSEGNKVRVMDIYTSVATWRFLLGVGIGAGKPLAQLWVLYDS
jgi:MFS transporter, PHS family, inorganic phosphate transporter